MLSHPSLSLHAMIMSWHQVQHTPSTAYTKYSIHRVQHTPSTAYTADCVIPRLNVSQPVSQLSADYVVLNSLRSHDYESSNELSLSFHRTCLSIYRLQIRSLQIDCLQIDHLQFNRLQINHLQVLLQSRLIMASKCISKLTRSGSPSSHDHVLLLITSWPINRVSASIAHASWSTASRLTPLRSIASRSTASKYSSNLDWSWPPSVSPNTLNSSIQVHLWLHSISVSKCISKHARLRRPSTSSWSEGTVQRFRVTEVDRVMGRLYSAHPGVDRHHLISISSYHTMKIHTLSFPTFGLTRSVRDFMDAQHRVVSYLLTRFLRSSNQNRSFSMGMSRWFSDYARLPSAARLNLWIYIERLE